MSWIFGVDFEGGCGPHVSCGLRALPLLGRRIDFPFLAPALPFPTSVSLPYEGSPLINDVNPWKDAHEGAHEVFRNPFPTLPEVALLGSVPAPLPTLEAGMGLTPRLVDGLGSPLASSEVDVEMAPAFLVSVLISLRFRGRADEESDSISRLAAEDDI
jgi:hypothetical protein